MSRPVQAGAGRCYRVPDSGEVAPGYRVSLAERLDSDRALARPLDQFHADPLERPDTASNREAGRPAAVLAAEELGELRPAIRTGAAVTCTARAGCR